MSKLLYCFLWKAVVNATLALAFLSKGLYQIGAMFQYYLLPDIPLQGSKDIDILDLLTFEVWEYIPTMLLVLTVTSKSVGGSSSSSGRDSYGQAAALSYSNRYVMSILVVLICLITAFPNTPTVEMRTPRRWWSTSSAACPCC